jgi:hypothetical protein
MQLNELMIKDFDHDDDATPFIDWKEIQETKRIRRDFEQDGKSSWNNFRQGATRRKSVNSWNGMR